AAAVQRRRDRDAGLRRTPQQSETLAHAPGAHRRLQGQPEFLIGYDKWVVGGRTRMRQAVADRNVGLLSLIGTEQMIPDQEHAAIVLVDVFRIARVMHAMG